MQSERKEISPLLYYILISTSTTLVFLLIGVLLLFSLRICSNSTFLLVVGFLLWKGVIIGFVIRSISKSSQNEEFVVKFTGRYLGSFFGLLIGGLLGARIGESLGELAFLATIFGALIFIIAGRWIGPKVSLIISRELKNVVSIKITQEPVAVIKAKPIQWEFLVLYSVVSPLLFVLLAFVFSYFDILVDDLAEFLPMTRMVVIVLSVISFGIPWLIRKNGLPTRQSAILLYEFNRTIIGLVYSILPVFYRFFLFVAFGGSIVEVALLALASSISALTWSKIYIAHQGQS